jgi:hypothetical protein
MDYEIVKKKIKIISNKINSNKKNGDQIQKIKKHERGLKLKINCNFIAY